MPRAAAVVVLLALVLPTVAASIEEVVLPEGSHPLAVAFAPDGTLWVTLDGPWALGAFDPATGNLTLHPLAAPPAPSATDEPGAPGDSLFALRRGPDGAWWTASQTNLHRVAPDGNASAFALPRATLLAGDVAFVDGKVLVALVTADAIGVYDPTADGWTVIDTPARFGPLHFDDADGEILVTGTYAGAVAVVDMAAGRVSGLFEGLAGPVGIDAEDQVWVAEMGSSSVGRHVNAVLPPLNEGDVSLRLSHFPTSPSPFYPSSGPSDVALVGGKVWFVEHFADRIALLDPVNGTLVEWMAPSAPGTNMQRLAVAPDGRVWFAEWSADRLGYVADDRAHDFPRLTPERIDVVPGGRQEVKSDAPVASIGSVTPGITGRATADGLVVTIAADAPLGEHLVLVSSGTRPYLEGTYLVVTVGTTHEDPALPVLAVLVALVLVARWRR